MDTATTAVAAKFPLVDAIRVPAIIDATVSKPNRRDRKWWAFEACRSGTDWDALTTQHRAAIENALLPVPVLPWRVWALLLERVPR